jgi:uncharacterized membrane protein
MSLKLYAIAVPIFFALDMIWIGFVAKDFYSKQIGYLLRPDVNWAAAIIFYLLFISALVVFVIAPAVQNNSWMHALLFGAFFGFVTYATYDLTNLALTKDWPLLVTIVDMLWGAAISGTVATLTYFVAQKF